MKVKISESKLRRIIRETIEESFIDKNELANFCLNEPFFFVADMGPMFGVKLRVANVDNLQQTIASEVLSAKNLTLSHDADSYFRKKIDPWADGNCVVKVTLDNEEYFILWER